ncbi:MAG TPA: hypothetical protein VFP84_16995, partial [Kofleriaceae bacterium]|nr:hypothetical protein [Kofleriaceae bacterium]
MTAEPYTDAATHLRDELRRAWLRVEYEVRLGWVRQAAPGVTATDAPAAPPASANDLMRLFAAARGERTGDEAGAQAVLQQFLELHRTVEARLAAAVAAGVRTPLVHLKRVFDLTPRQWASLMFALLPEADPNLVQAYRHLARDQAARGLDGRLLALLVYDTPEARSLMARDLSNSSPLLRYQLIDLAPGDSLLFRRIRAASRLVHLLDGTSLELDPELAELAEVRGRRVDGEFPAVAIQLATAAIRSSEVVLAVQGQRGLGKRHLLQRAATHWNQRLLVIDGKRLAMMPALAQAVAIRALVRELLLLDAIPVFADIDDVVIRDGDRDELPGFFGALLDSWSGPIAITVNRERMPRIHHRPLVHLTLDVPGLAVRTQLWRQVVPSLDEPGADSLSGRFAIPGGIIVAAAHAAIAGRMPDAPPPGAEDLAHAVAAQLHQRISRLGKKLATPFDLDDLIVDDDTRAALIEIASAARERRKVRELFKLRGAQGISVLFSGHP